MADFFEKIDGYDIVTRDESGEPYITRHDAITMIETRLKISRETAEKIYELLDIPKIHITIN